MSNLTPTAAVHNLGLLPDSYARRWPSLQYQPFGPFFVDFRLITGSDRYVRAFLRIGNANVVLQDIEKTNANGIAVAGVTVGQTLYAKTTYEIHISVSRYGPVEIDATIQFIFHAPCALRPIIAIKGSRLQYAVSAPRPITLDAAIEEAYSNVSQEIVYYDTLEFTDEKSGDTVQIVHSGEPLETPQGTYAPCRFGCKHPDTEGGVVGSLQITVDFLPRAAQKWILETCKIRGAVTVIWRQYLGPGQEPDAWYPVPLSVTSIEQSYTGVVITATFPLLTAMKFPRRLMTAEALPGGRY